MVYRRARAGRGGALFAAIFQEEADIAILQRPTIEGKLTGPFQALASIGSQQRQPFSECVFPLLGWGHCCQFSHAMRSVAAPT